MAFTRSRRIRLLAAGVVLVGTASAAFAVDAAVAPTPGKNAQTTTGKMQLGLGYVQWEPQLTSFGSGSDASSVSLNDASSLAGFEVDAPSSEAFTDPAEGQLIKVWSLPESDDGENYNVVALEYAHLEIVEQQMPATYDANRTYEQLVHIGIDPGGSIVTVNGVTGYIAPPSTTDGQEHPGYLDYTVDGVQTTIEAYYPETELLAIASSMTPISP